MWFKYLEQNEHDFAGDIPKSICILDGAFYVEHEHIISVRIWKTV